MQAMREITNTAGAATDAAPSKPMYPDTLLALRASGPRFTLDDFLMGKKQLGAGMFGKVYKAQHRETKRPLVIKVIEKKSIMREDCKPQLQREIEVHSRLIHPNIIRMYSYFQDDDRAYIVMELANRGTLYEKMQTSPNKMLDEREAAHFIKQLCLALEFCHSRNVIHRDIKPENILLVSNPEGGYDNLKLADFGYAVAQRNASRRTTMCGTVEYLPPEVVDGDTYAFGFDMWCVGVLLYEMLAGQSPFYVEGGDQDAIMAEIGRCELKQDRAMRAKRSAWQLITSLLRKDHTERLTATAVLKHPFIVQHTGPYKPQPCVTAWIAEHGESLATRDAAAASAGAAPGRR